jgi:hypothetical protein
MWLTQDEILAVYAAGLEVAALVESLPARLTQLERQIAALTARAQWRRWMARDLQSPAFVACRLP